MGYRIELWTEHEDNGAAIHALAKRVGEDSLTLTSGEDVPEGEWVAFEVKLADGSVFLEGMGRCQGSVAKDPLFDVNLGMLQLETRDQMLFERIQLAAEDIAQGTRPTGEVDISEIEKAAAEKKAAEKNAEKKAPPPLPKPPPKPPAPPKVAKPEPKPAPKPEPKAEAKAEAKDAAPKKKKWPWQKTTEPGMPSPDPVEPPKAAVSRPPPPVSKPPPPVSPRPPVSPPTPVSKPPPNADPPLSPQMRQRLMNVVPVLVAEGRVRDLAGAHELALQIGLQALETFLEDED